MTSDTMYREDATPIAHAPAQMMSDTQAQKAAALVSDTVDDSVTVIGSSLAVESVIESFISSASDTISSLVDPIEEMYLVRRSVVSLK